MELLKSQMMVFAVLVGHQILEVICVIEKSGLKRPFCPETEILNVFIFDYRFFPMPILGIPRGGSAKIGKNQKKTKNDPIIPAVVCSYTLKCYIFITLIYYQCKVNKI